MLASFVILLVLRVTPRPVPILLPATRSRLALRFSRGLAVSEEAALIQEGLRRLLARGSCSGLLTPGCCSGLELRSDCAELYLQVSPQSLIHLREAHPKGVDLLSTPGLLGRGRDGFMDVSVLQLLQVVLYFHDLGDAVVDAASNVQQILREELWRRSRRRRLCWGCRQ